MGNQYWVGFRTNNQNNPTRPLRDKSNKCANPGNFSSMSFKEINCFKYKETKQRKGIQLDKKWNLFLQIYKLKDGKYWLA